MGTVYLWLWRLRDNINFWSSKLILWSRIYYISRYFIRNINIIWKLLSTTHFILFCEYSFMNDDDVLSCEWRCIIYRIICIFIYIFINTYLTILVFCINKSKLKSNSLSSLLLFNTIFKSTKHLILRYYLNIIYIHILVHIDCSFQSYNNQQRYMCHERTYSRLSINLLINHRVYFL